MSYADQSHLTGSSRALGLGASLTLVGGVILGMLTLAPVLVPGEEKPGAIPIIRIPPEPTPPPPAPRAKASEPKARTPAAPARPVDPIIAIPSAPSGPILSAGDPPLAPGTGGTGTATEPVVADPPPPLFVDAAPDPRYAGDFQPPYPASELRADREGVVVMQVRIGANGRVIAVEKLSATSDAFYNAARRHALARWRFRPATRGGVPVETDRRMTLRFTITER